MIASHISPAFRLGMMGSHADSTKSALTSLAIEMDQSGVSSSSSPPRHPAKAAASMLMVSIIAIILLFFIRNSRSSARTTTYICYRDSQKKVEKGRFLEKRLLILFFFIQISEYGKREYHER